MNRMRCEVSYDGTHFHGFQIQPNVRTVQGVLESALTVMHKGRLIRVHVSGRTDTGVHAREQVVHFDTPLDIADGGWRRALHTLLPDDITVHCVRKVSPDFHARWTAVKKEYRYRVLCSPEADVFRRHYTYHYPYPLELSLMRKAAAYLVGTHDFSSFCSAQSDVDQKVRTLETVDMISDEDELVFQLIGHGFLRNMVRIIVGTLLEIGGGRRSLQDMKRILQAKDRRLAGKTVPGYGLILWKVIYEDDLHAQKGIEHFPSAGFDMNKPLL